VCTIANYEYGFFFYFYLDGTVETEVKLTGILSTGSLSYEEYQAGGRKYGINLGGHLYAPVHQHFFLCKMDFVVDGTDNRVVEYNVEADSTGPHNPSGNGFYYTETLLDTELGTDCCAETARFWKIQSGSKVLTHSLTHSLTH
jgi:primary-amine oxidase